MGEEKYMTIIDSKKDILLMNLGDNKIINDLFWKIQKETKCNYLTYMIENNNIKVYFSSYQDWQDVFLKESLINICPIYRYAFEAIENDKNHVFTLWDNVIHKKGEEADLMDLRMSYNIGHGLGLAIKEQNFRESFVIAGEVKDKDFGFKISKSKKIIDDSLKVFRSTIKSKM